MKKIIIVISCILSIAVGFISRDIIKREPERIIEKSTYIMARIDDYLQRERINQDIDLYLRDGNVDKLLKIFSHICSDREIAHLIMINALYYEIPVCLLFSVVFNESGFNPNAINIYRDHKDYGLMQLNKNSFKGYSENELLRIDVNLRLGCEYLVKLKNRYGSWGLAIIHYNGLYEKGAGEYLVKVFEKEREFESIYNKYKYVYR